MTKTPSTTNGNRDNSACENCGMCLTDGKCTTCAEYWAMVGTETE